MTPLPVIHFHHVHKHFTLSAEAPQTVLETLIGLFRRRGRGARSLQAVNDVSFSVMPGQSFGIIGRNGSGKSTVLKLAAGILRPNSGKIYVQGRISALLELGAGFHPDLTGRDNIYLNGSILGLSRTQIDERFDDIVAFSELGAFIDTPVKHYSSGMYMRLGFAVAVHVDPAILIVDEILAVGDYAFQTKCLDRIRKMRQRGVTIIMVSHHLPTMRNLCTHLIWMDHGNVRAAGPVQDVIEQYMAHFQADAPPGQQVAGFRRWGSGEVEISHVHLLDEAAHERTEFNVAEPIVIEIGYHAHQPVHQPEFGLALYTQDGTHVIGPNNVVDNVPVDRIEGAGTMRYTIAAASLLPGSYRLTVAIHNSELPHAFDFHEQAYILRVVSGGRRWPEGLVQLPAQWEWIPMAADEILTPFSS